MNGLKVVDEPVYYPVFCVLSMSCSFVGILFKLASTFSGFLFRVLCDRIGDAFDIEPATSEILLKHGIDDREFTPEVCLNFSCITT